MYVLIPMCQMSLWGATVITDLISAYSAWIGCRDIVAEFILGGFRRE